MTMHMWQVNGNASKVEKSHDEPRYSTTTSALVGIIFYTPRWADCVCSQLDQSSEAERGSAVARRYALKRTLCAARRSTAHGACSTGPSREGEHKRRYDP